MMGVLGSADGVDPIMVWPRRDPVESLTNFGLNPAADLLSNHGPLKSACELRLDAIHFAFHSIKRRKEVVRRLSIPTTRTLKRATKDIANSHRSSIYRRIAINIHNIGLIAIS